MPLGPRFGSLVESGLAEVGLLEGLDILARLFCKEVIGEKLDARVPSSWSSGGGENLGTSCCRFFVALRVE